MVRTQNRQRINVQNLTSHIFARISYKTKFSNKKGNRSLLAIDILKGAIKKDLLDIVASKVERTYLELLEQDSPYSIMHLNGNTIFLQLVKETCDSFLVKQYGCDVKLNLNEFANS